jgi:3-phenylpropionate/trans-cinnamate dioxygenase ferredoxin reductase component
VAKEPIVIVGGGLATARFIDEYRAGGGEALITVLSADAYPPYNRPPLSKGVLRQEMDALGALVHPLDTYEEMLVELRLGTVVEDVDTDAREVVLAGGEHVRYGTLVIASGTRARPLLVQGADLPAVHTFRTIEDALAVSADAEGAHKVLVVGGSFIGSEVAASLRLRGLEVTIVEMGPRLVPALCSDELSQQFTELYRERGVDVLLDETIEEFRGNGQMLTGARTESGREIEAFLVVVGIGVVPNTEFLEGSGIALDNGVVVDQRFHASVKDVYAVGDVARFNDLVAGRSRRIEHWGNADKQGALLGRNLAGGRKQYAEVAVFFTKLFDLQLQVYGDLDGGVDEFVLRGSVAEGRLLGFYLRDGRLTGAVAAGQSADVADELKALLVQRPQAGDRNRLANTAIRPAAAFAG